MVFRLPLLAAERRLEREYVSLSFVDPEVISYGILSLETFQLNQFSYIFATTLTNF